MRFRILLTLSLLLLTTTSYSGEGSSGGGPKLMDDDRESSRFKFLQLAKTKTIQIKLKDISDIRLKNGYSISNEEILNSIFLNIKNRSLLISQEEKNNIDDIMLRNGEIVTAELLFSQNNTGIGDGG
jgi:hypothetical protein